MYLWRRLALPAWWEAQEKRVRVEGGSDLAIIELPGRKRLTLEISCRTRKRADGLVRQFGGSVTRLRTDWLKRFMRAQKAESLQIGNRLVISNVGETSASRLRPGPESSRYQGDSHILIPAGAAFGTGQHSTTAMSLRLLEQLTRSWSSGWSMIDVGTGSGIFALAAKRFGAGHVAGIDIDPIAISTAKGNARFNRIAGVHFEVADILRWRLPIRPMVTAANLFSELLIAALPKLRRAQFLILSGVMREQEPDLIKGLKRNRVTVLKTRRRGKWIALLARSAGTKP